MLTYDEALRRVLDAVEPLPGESVALADASGRALAAPIVATENLPPFDNSAVDGYAVGTGYQVRYAGELVDEVYAGDVPKESVGGAKTAYVATGAMLPGGTTGLVMVEDSKEVEGGIELSAEPSPRYIRRAGSDVREGETVLSIGDTVTPGAVGLLASLGIGAVSCHARPRVGILSTGNELVPPTTRPLPTAKIRDSNRFALAAAVEEAGAIVEHTIHAPDDRAAIRDALLSLSGCDVVISSGGVSVGSADFVREVLEETGTLDFWRVSIKPGKPLAFGRIGNAIFFGLPGNPASSLATFELFVRPVLRRFAGHRDTGRPQITATLAENLPHEPGRREFVRAHIRYDSSVPVAHVTGGQESHRTASYATANALLVANENHGDYKRGETLPALLLV